ncbi:oar-like outer membrane protein protein, OmpA family [Pseudoalteromonas sp. SW0106-04]|uniref:carboxypeptidase regulatory-like domain-containing protein n=1 Tax=Pseudoalteromonas sp. SW0106-04 TaxID=1702169 RepID=UPI0006B4FCC8|nr:carboxypeptidase regulatory-like domain-containing protein [Pseudoalteromonas sp. SW0106-04]GAP73512.1 oar-like outer membrane protein protein, OmpA family [Pseudoalteromonas sp. SW0106-04]
MKMQLRKSALSMAIAATVGMSSGAFANETASSVKGQITGPNGNPAAGTEVTIIHLPTGSAKTAVVNDAGYFSAKGLRVGGPYNVLIDSDKFEDQVVENVYLSLGKEYPVTVQLQAKGDIEQIVVTGRPISSFSGGTGPAATFTQADLESAPAINRDIKDIVRADPRIYVDDSRDAIHCGGANPRFNSLTLDGVRMNDNFGLNSNGYPTVRQPFSFDALEQVAVEMAPFDVQYGSFTSCNINAVTKSGTNELHGGVFFDYTNDSMKGDSIDEIDGDIDNGNYTEKRYGFNVGMPLIEDKLFLFTSYEKLEGVKQFDYGPVDNGNISQSDIDRIRQITSDVYNYDIGGTPGSMPIEDEKLLVKLDWNINEDHRASVVYNYNDGFDLSQSDADNDELAFSSHFYERGAEFYSIVGSLYSDWSANFSTEVRIGKSDLDARQESLDAASGFGEFQITYGPNDDTVYIGPDDSRQSNDLNWDNLTAKISGTYYLDQHTITAGYEYEDLNVFNLFVQHTEGEFRFDSIEDYEQGIADRVYYYNAAGSNNPNDLAAEFSYQVHTLYVQDEYSFTDIDATLLFGLRYDKYQSDDYPNFNAQFENRYGFSNQQNLDGVDLLQPRVGFNWFVDDALEIRAGFGLYSGGNPNVWASSAYQNDGVTQIQLSASGVDLFNTAMTNGDTPGYGVPQSLFDEIAATTPGAGDSATHSIDPDFEIPSEWKYSVGATYTFENDYVVNLDVLHTQKQDSAYLQDIALRDSGETTFDGRPIFESIEGRNQEYMLTNVDGDDGESTIISAALSKSYDNGIDFTVAYAFTDSEDVNPMNSSVAASNYSNFATTNPGMPGPATSDYEVPHRFTLRLGYTQEFFDGYETRFNLLGQASEGLPYSYVFDTADSQFGDFNNYGYGSRQLLYVPLENDPNVVYNMSAEDLAAFNAFIEEEGLKRGSVTDRNSENAEWYVKFDLKVTQQLPGFAEGHKGEVFFVIDNLTNLLNDDWGTYKKGSFVGNRMVDMNIDSNGRYVYTGFNDGNQDTSVQRDASLWEMRIGVRYTF